MSANPEQLGEQNMDAITGRTEGHKAAAPQENTGEKKLFEVSYVEYADKDGPFKGIINEFDFHRLLKAVNGATLFSLKAGKDEREQLHIDQRVTQVTRIAEDAGIELDNSNGMDPRTLLFVIMRGEQKPADLDYHHSTMSGSRMFEEVLKMLGDTESLKKLSGEITPEPKKRSEMSLTEKGHKSQTKYATENLRIALETANRNTETNSRDEERNDGGK